jgi:hypothetical protein
MIANASRGKQEGTGRMLRRVLCFSLLLAMPAWAGQQSQTPPGTPPKGDAKPEVPPQEDTPLKPASVSEDISVAEFYIHKGDTDAAIPRIEDAIHQQPGLAKPRLLLAEAYERKDDKVSAAKYYKAYLQAFPDASDKKKIEKKIQSLEAAEK